MLQIMFAVMALISLVSLGLVYRERQVLSRMTLTLVTVLEVVFLLLVLFGIYLVS